MKKKMLLYFVGIFGLMFAIGWAYLLVDAIAYGESCIYVVHTWGIILPRIDLMRFDNSEWYKPLLLVVSHLAVFEICVCKLFHNMNWKYAQD